jgi:hypothetical protein
MKLCGLDPNSYIHVPVSESDLYIPRIGLPIWLHKIGRQILGVYINRSQIHKCGNWETEHYSSVLEIRCRAFSFLGLHQSEPDNYIRFSPALHLQCTVLYYIVTCRDYTHIKPQLIVASSYFNQMTLTHRSY